jgi:hypothetical protein
MAPTFLACMCLQASCTVAVGGSVSGFWFRMISAISRFMRTSLRLAAQIGTGSSIYYHHIRIGTYRPAITLVEELQGLSIHEKQSVAEPLYTGL